MPLKLYYHPLSSFCHKALIALYEGGVPFEPVFVDLGHEQSSATLRALWPVGKFPVLHDDTRGHTIAEASVIIEYLDAHCGTHLIPTAADCAWQARMWDRFYDLYVHVQMQKIVGDNMRAPEGKDPVGVDLAVATIRNSYAIIEKEMANRTWALGDDYSLVDCAASPALFYACIAVPFDGAHRSLRRYYDRLMARPSYARALREAQPYFHLFPMSTKPVLPAGSP